MEHKRLSREDLKRLKDKCKRQDYEAIVALLAYSIAEGTDNALETSSDHRYHQGKVKALKDFFNDIVPKS